MKIGTSNINQMYIGGSQVSAAYLGWEQVFPETQPSPTGDTKVIMYRSTDEQTITPRKIRFFNFYAQNMRIVSNTYDLQNGGVMIFSDNVLQIPGDSFSGYNLTEIVIPQSVTTIETDAFRDSTYLSSVTLPENVYLAAGCFEGCTALSSITIPDNTVLGAYIFSGCISLSSVTFGSGITLSANSGGTGMFSDCSSLQSFVIPSFFDKVPAHMFQGCINLSSVTIPSSVTNIGESAFQHCAISSITIPNSVINIDRYAFSICSNLSTINYSGTMSQWSLITLGTSWNSMVPATVVHCSDGDVSL